MQEPTITKFKVFAAWQDEKEELWLRQMAQQGLHLASLGLPGFYRFQRREPQDVIYRLDFVTSRADMQEYLQLFGDAGWEHLGAMGGWQYFRKPASAAGPDEIYTDPQSKVEKYRRLMGVLIVFLPIWIVLLTNVTEPPPYGWHFITAIRIFSLLVMLLLAYGTLRVALRIRELRKQ
jgi:hypothetical protein